MKQLKQLIEKLPRGGRMLFREILASEMEVSTVTIIHWENGTRTPKLANAVKIPKAVGAAMENYKTITSKKYNTPINIKFKLKDLLSDLEEDNRKHKK